ncbi:1-acyl-sn-glycerol-3-phosphate acyltransferase epsilon-like [Thrips palmi]|uniref:1-acyl-sn-glycerol-3-phosphate acyltransferase epsilon-like n=1 Tax=Thrips palmi TaxID=161013 RepID=A0A6P8YNN7_THRPL|nr:1-acyl-sn-glycerol-3-phosphate acyltransferase epsilon-like [Thrips palmi]
MGPDSIMAFFTSKLANPTTLSKLRPQLSGVALAFIAVSLVALVPFLSFMWHMACVLAFFVAVDSMALKDKAFAYFIRIAVFFFVRAPGLKVHLYGDFEELQRRDENVLYMGNHQSSLDWLVACSLASWSRSLQRIRFMMKQELAWLPMIGYYTKVVGHIYIRRKGFKPDKLMESLADINNTKRPFWLAIYPEGTRYNPDDTKAIASSDESAVQQYPNMGLLKHQLTPKAKGTWLMIKNMRSKLKAVYSATLVYEQAEPKGQRRRAPTATEVLAGGCTDSHLYVKRIPIEEVPDDETAFATWLFAQCQDRDRMMADYYNSRSFSSWGPRMTYGGDSLFMDLVILALFTLGMLVSPFVRTIYLVQAVLGTLWGYGVLTFKPTF